MQSQTQSLLQRPNRWVGALLCSLVVCLGCGKGDYEKLVKTRIEQLNDPSKYGILIWEEVKNPSLMYVVSMPKGQVEVSPNDGEGFKAETRDVVFGSSRFQFRMQSFQSNTDPEALAAAVEKQYRSDGYEDIPDEEKDVTPASISRSVKSLYLKHPERGLARVEVVAFDNQRICTMAVLGQELDDATVVKFFKSAQMRR